MFISTESQNTNITYLDYIKVREIFMICALENFATVGY